MDFIEETKRFFYFNVNKSQEMESNILTVGNLLRFPKNITEHREAGKFDEFFKSKKQCIEWWDKMKSAERDVTKVQTKTFQVFYESEKNITITKKEWDLVQSQMTVPENFEKEDIRIYHPYPTNNFMDRSAERIDKYTLNALAKTMIGKPIILGHKHDLPGEGRIFDAKLVKKSIDETMTMIGETIHKKSDFINHLKWIEEKDGAIYWMQESFYVIKEQAELIRKIDAGIIKDMSISFRARKLVPVRGKDDQIMLWEYQGGGEATETSFVWLGDTHGAENSKSAEDNKNKELEIDNTEEIEDEDISIPVIWSELINRKDLPDGCFAVIEPAGKDGQSNPLESRHLPHHGIDAETGKVTGADLDLVKYALEQISEIKAVSGKITFRDLREKAKFHLLKHLREFESNEIGGNTTMKITLKSLNFQSVIDLEDEADIKKTFSEVESAAVTMSEEAVEKALIGPNAVITVLKEFFGESYNSETLKSQLTELKTKAAFTDSTRDGVIDDILKMQIASGMVKNDPESVGPAKKHLEGLSFEQLTIMQKQFNVAVEANEGSEKKQLNKEGSGTEKKFPNIRKSNQVITY